MDIEKLKQKILDLAIRGKLVPQDPNDEPASVLIEKIRNEKEELIKQGKIKRDKNESYIYKGSDNCYYENNSTVDFSAPLDVSSNFIWIKGKHMLFPMESTKPLNNFDYIDIEAIDNKLNIIANPKSHTVETAPSRATRKIYPTSTLFSMVRPYLRNIAFVGEKYKDCIASTGFYVCTPMSFIDPEYLFILLKSDFIVNSLNFYMKGDNSPSINGGHIEEFLFPIPSLNYQRKVVNRLKQILPQIDNILLEALDLTNIINKLKQKILDYYYGENSCYKSYFMNKNKEHLKNFIPSKYIGDGDWVLSENMDPNGDYKLIQLKHIGNNQYLNKPYNTVSKEFVNQNNCSIIKSGTLLINRLVADKMNCCILPETIYNHITSVDVCWIAKNDSIDNEYLMYLLSSPSFQTEVMNKCSGSTRKRISKKNLLDIKVFIHNYEYQLIIKTKIQEIFCLLDSISI